MPLQTNIISQENLTSPASWANMDLKESSMSSSVISSWWLKNKTKSTKIKSSGPTWVFVQRTAQNTHLIFQISRDLIVHFSVTHHQGKEDKSAHKAPQKVHKGHQNHKLQTPTLFLTASLWKLAGQSRPLCWAQRWRGRWGTRRAADGCGCSPPAG